MNKPRWLYHLVGADGVIRYVGSTVRPWTRLIAHVSLARSVRKDAAEGRRGTQRFNRFFRWLLAEEDAGRRPALVLVRELAELSWREEEQLEIYRMIKEGHPILNLALSRKYDKGIVTEQALSERDRYRAALIEIAGGAVSPAEVARAVLAKSA